MLIAWKYIFNMIMTAWASNLFKFIITHQWPVPAQQPSHTQLSANERLPMGGIGQSEASILTPLSLTCLKIDNQDFLFRLIMIQWGRSLLDVGARQLFESNLQNSLVDDCKNFKPPWPVENQCLLLSFCCRNDFKKPSLHNQIQSQSLKSDTD